MIEAQIVNTNIADEATDDNTAGNSTFSCPMDLVI